MNTKIKFIAGLGLVAGLLAVSQPARAASYTLLGSAQALYVTNGIAITNILLASSQGTNVAGTVFTNLFGTRVAVNTGYTNAQGTITNAGVIVPLLGGAELPTWTLPINVTNAQVTTDIRSPFNISVKFAANSGANAAVRFTISPSWNGTDVDNSTAFDWTFAFTPTASTTFVSATNVPAWLWNGAKKIVLSRIVNADTDASSDVIVTAVDLNTPDTP